MADIAVEQGKLLKAQRKVIDAQDRRITQVQTNCRLIAKESAEWFTSKLNHITLPLSIEISNVFEAVQTSMHFVVLGCD